MSKKLTPSKELVGSTSSGASVGAAVEIAAAAFGVPLPPGSGALLAGLLAGVFHWSFGRGRKE